MPHLAPLSWALAPLLFWSLLLCFLCILWWNKVPDFPQTSSFSNHSFSSWNWS